MKPKDDSGSVLMNRSENKKDKLQSSIRHQPNLKPTPENCRQIFILL
jgi:hypothetical protein